MATGLRSGEARRKMILAPWANDDDKAYAALHADRYEPIGTPWEASRWLSLAAAGRHGVDLGKQQAYPNMTGAGQAPAAPGAAPAPKPRVPTPQATAAQRLVGQGEPEGLGYVVGTAKPLGAQAYAAAQEYAASSRLPRRNIPAEGAYTLETSAQRLARLGFTTPTPLGGSRVPTPIAPAAARLTPEQEAAYPASASLQPGWGQDLLRTGAPASPWGRLGPAVASWWNQINAAAGPPAAGSDAERQAMLQWEMETANPNATFAPADLPAVQAAMQPSSIISPITGQPSISGAGTSYTPTGAAAIQNFTDYLLNPTAGEAVEPQPAPTEPFYQEPPPPVPVDEDALAREAERHARGRILYQQMIQNYLDHVLRTTAVPSTWAPGGAGWGSRPSWLGDGGGGGGGGGYNSMPPNWWMNLVNWNIR